ncbi:hypothetical protein ROHU_001916 [Labeo rohita]|uniref:Uncharacterized protein n=1 Tax=Labeo rohita TaxID=84645 RepID=A0A498P2C2_LABRO|nr:hypothetical protein ROHU_001916 [Labeo rohita]
MVETLNELAQLRNSGFGRPRPRHGLKLLYWFASECVSFENNDMLSQCDPAEKDFGFHYFENRYDQTRNKLLPDINFPYYVVGNLNSQGAEELPDYVSEDKYTDDHDSNTDRIIVSVYDEERFDRVYVTQHHDRSNYDPNATYRISKGLLTLIRRMSLNEFLVAMGYYQNKQYVPPMPAFNFSPQTTNTVILDLTAVTSSSNDSSDSEFPATQSSSTVIQMHDDTPAQKKSENFTKVREPTANGWWERLCTIL